MAKAYKKSGFMKGIVVLIISQVVIKIIGLVYRLYLTNKENFGDQGNAIMAGAFQVYMLLLTITSVGIPNAIAKLTSSKLAVVDNKGAYKIFKVAFFLFSTIGFICSLALFLGAELIATQYLQIPEAKMALMALAPSLFITSVSSVLKGYYNGRESMTIAANSLSIEQLVKAVATIAIVEIISNLSGNNTILMAVRMYCSSNNFYN